MKIINTTQALDWIYCSKGGKAPGGVTYRRVCLWATLENNSVVGLINDGDSLKIPEGTGLYVYYHDLTEDQKKEVNADNKINESFFS